MNLPTYILFKPEHLIKDWETGRVLKMNANFNWGLWSSGRNSCYHFHTRLKSNFSLHYGSDPRKIFQITNEKTAFLGRSPKQASFFANTHNDLLSRPQTARIVNVMSPLPTVPYQWCVIGCIQYINTTWSKNAPHFFEI